MPESIRRLSFRRTVTSSAPGRPVRVVPTSAGVAGEETTVKVAAAIAACRSSRRSPTPLLPTVLAAVTVTMPRSTWVPVSTVSSKLVSALRCPSANSTKPSAVSSCVQAGASTLMSPPADSVIELNSLQVVKWTLPPTTMPSSAQGFCAVGVPLPVPPRTSIVLPAIRSWPRRTWPSAVILMTDSPPKVLRVLPRYLPRASYASTISPPATTMPWMSASSSEVMVMMPSGSAVLTRAPPGIFTPMWSVLAPPTRSTRVLARMVEPISTSPPAAVGARPPRYSWPPALSSTVPASSDQLTVSDTSLPASHTCTTSPPETTLPITCTLPTASTTTLPPEPSEVWPPTIRPPALAISTP